jgi:molybdopterin molybdotransferase
MSARGGTRAASERDARDARPAAELLGMEEAWALVAARLRPLETEAAPLAAAAGRVLAAPARAVIDLPPFHRSAMDGFAVRAADTDGRPLRIAGEVAAGDAEAPPVAPGTAVRISTGALLPPGADAVLRAESATVLGGSVVPDVPLAAGRYVRFRGEDVHADDVLAPAGATLTVQRMASLASAGIGEVRVHRRPRVHVLINGDELQLPGTPPLGGAVYESNGLVLRHLVARCGCEVVDGGIVGDDADAVRDAVAAGLAGDVLIVSGGMSVGPHDHVKPAFADCGVDELLWRVRIKPGKPFWFGVRGRTLVFGLPGNPLSSLVGFLLFVEPALRRLQGDAAAAARIVGGRAASPLSASDERTTLLTSRMERGPDGVLLAAPTARQGSHMTGALGESDGFAIVPHERGEIAAGEPVALLLTPDTEDPT